MITKEVRFTVLPTVEELLQSLAAKDWKSPLSVQVRDANDNTASSTTVCFVVICLGNDKGQDQLWTVSGYIIEGEKCTMYNGTIPLGDKKPELSLLCARR